MLGFFLSNLCLGFFAYRVAASLPAGADAWVRATVLLLCFQVGAAGSAALLAVLGLLTPGPQVVVAGLLALIGLAFRRTAHPPPQEALPWGGSLLAGTLSLWLLGPAFTGTHLSYDDATYHAALPAWMLGHGGGIAPFTYQAYYPLHSEMVSLWFMVPTGDLTHAGLAPVVNACLLAVAGVALARRMGAEVGTATVVFAALLVSRRVLRLSFTVSSSDLCAAADLVAALALATTVPTWGFAVLAGVATGAALGTKLTTAMAVLGVGFTLLWRHWGAPNKILGFLVAVVLVGGGWYVRNLLLTGNPVFPAAIGPFAGPLDPATQAASSLGAFLGDWASIQQVLTTRLNWPTPLGIAGLAGLTLALGQGVRGRRPQLLVVALCGLLPILLLPSQPFSGTINRPDQPLNTIVRYLLPSMALGMVGLVAVVRPAWARWGAPLLWLLVVLLSRDVFDLRSLVVFGLGVLLFVVWRRWSVPGWVLGLGLLGLYTVRTPMKARRTAAGLVNISLATRRQAALWGAVGELPAGARVAQVADVPVSNDLSIRAFGPHLDLHYVPVDLDGKRLRPLHQRWRNEPAGWWWRWEAVAGQGFVQNLEQADVDYLIVSTCNEGRRWPSVREQLVVHPERRVFTSRCGEIWRAR